MKLVDILARELKVWPDCARYIIFDNANGCYADLGQGYTSLGIDCSDFSDDHLDRICTTVYRGQWQAAVDALKAEKVVARHGDGLPPVGLTVEWYSDSQTGWQEIIVLAYHGMDAWIKPKGKSSTIVGNIANFRPIRTPEQIAAEEMANGVREMRQVMAQAKCGRDSELEALWLAGYRKFEIVDN